jgi:pimeloyl-ACP methyl ester carboxylesterase
MLHDLIIVLPGIMGSELRKANGELLWGMSWRMIWNLLMHGGFATLTLPEDDPEEDVVDAVTATGLMPIAQIIPGFWKIDFYTAVVTKLQSDFPEAFRAVATREAIFAGPISGRDATGRLGLANLLEFPYDWRRDNRVAARHLKTLIDQQADAITRSTGDRPRAILVAHSMGGLVARHYLSVGGGWESCKALFSYGTPYRGAPQSLHYLMNGYPGMPAYVADVLRSFTAVYQLLPAYPVVLPDGATEYRRVHEVPSLPGVDSERAKAGRQFHEDMLEKASDELPDDCYFLPYVGIGQPTTQAFHWDGSAYRLSEDLPPFPGTDARTAAEAAKVFAGGDGTLPRISATPLEFSKRRIERFVVERHASLLTNVALLNELVQLIRELQEGEELGQYWAPPGEAVVESTPDEPMLSVHLDDLYDDGLPVTVRLRVVSGNPMSPPEVTILPVDNPALALTMKAAPVSGDAWEVTFPPQTANLYHVEARATVTGSHPTLSVHDIFVVDSPNKPPAS